MNRQLRALCLCVAVLDYTVVSNTATAQFFSYQTKNLRIVYYDQQEAYLLPHIARCFENSLRFHRALFDYTPSEEVTVFLHDMNDYGSGGTNSIPWNYLTVGIEPFDYVYETCPTNERMNWMMNHELAHVVDLDKAAGSDRFFRSLFFGKVAPAAENPLSIGYSYLASPRYYSPRWYHEGVAVFLETWMAGGIGRTLGGYDEMVFRAMMRDSARVYDFVGLESEGKTIDFQIGANSYLYGTRFVSYLAATYGPGKILQWFNRTDGSDAYFASQFKHVYGSPLDEEWSRWIEFERQWQRENLDSIRKYPVTPERPITQSALGSVSRTFYDSARDKFYVAINYPGRIAHIASIDRSTGKVQSICDVPTPALYYVASLAYDDSAGLLFFTTHNGSLWRDLNVVIVRTGEVRTLIPQSRVGDLAFNRADKSLWGVRHHTGYSSLVRIPPPYESMYAIQTLEYGKDVFDLDVSPDGQTLTASYIQVSGRQQLITMNIDSLLADTPTINILYEFENNAPENFVFSPDGRYLYGTSYFTGVSNVFRYNFATQEMEALSNCETGYFRPLPIGTDSLFVYRYTGRGFQPVVIPIQVRLDLSAIKYLGQEIVEKYPIVKSWNIGSPLSIQIDSVKTHAGDYNGLAHVQLASVYPIVQGYKDFFAYGLTVNAADPVGLHTFDLNALYSPYPHLPRDERLHLGFNYKYWQWSVSAGYNRSDFYDLFGPTKTSRKGYALSVRYNDFIFNERPRTLDYTISLAGYTGLERLPEFQNVATSYDKFMAFNAQLNYKFLLRSLGFVDYEKGVQWGLSTPATLVRSTFYPKILANFDYGIMLTTDHSSIWIRTSAGYALGAQSEPFANFYFGGFGNNWVDYQEAKRYREYYSFPGVEINEVGGTEFGKLLIEWTLPPLRFRRAGLPNFYCTWAHLGLFSSLLSTDLSDKLTRRTLTNIGVQVDWKFILFTSQELTLSFGYATAFERDQRAKREFMVSLKIL